MKLCGNCNTLKDYSSFNKCKSKKDGYDSCCRDCKKTKYINNRSSHIEKVKKRYLSKKDEILQKKRESYTARKDDINKERRTRRILHPGVDAAYQKMIRDRVKVQCIDSLGGECISCGTKDINVLCVDHINNDGALERKKVASSASIYRSIVKNGHQNKYQLLCFNCNLRKEILKDRCSGNVGILKNCPTCISQLDVSHFKHDSKYPDGFYYECRKCDRNRTLILKLKALSSLGAMKCSCGEEDPLVLSFDHIYEDGYKGRNDGLGRSLYMNIFNKKADLSRYQVKCMNCNCKKHIEYKRNQQNPISPNKSLEPHKSHCSEIVDFKVCDVEVKRTTDIKLIIPFLDSYHYGGYGRYETISYSAYYQNQLIAVVKYASPIRIEAAKSAGFKYNTTLELDRMCIKPEYQKKNLASYIISRSVKLLKVDRPDIVSLISFADPSYGHQGIIYRASNWKDLGYGSRSYVYVDSSGQKIHKKTVYESARSRGLKESEFASSMNYVKTYTMAKRKFSYVLRS